MRRHIGNLLFDLPFDVLDAPGEVLELGCNRDEISLWLQSANEIAGQRPVMAIEGWQWLEFRYSRDELREYEEAGLLPVYLWSVSVVVDSSNRWRPGDWILTHELKQLHDKVIFEAKRTVYVMVGPSVRKIITSRF